MIYVNMRGNIGNQLFTYALAKKVQYLTNQKICVNYYYLNKYKKEYKFDLNKYRLNENVIFENKKKLPFFANPYTIFSKFARKICPNFYFKIMSNFGIYMWLGAQYKEINLKRHKNYYIDGYYQCDKYFNDIRDKILKEFTPIDEKCEKNKKMYELIEKTNSVCVTIRRGDYISNPTYKKKFFICDKDYFYRACKEIENLVDNPTYFIFSDDIQWAKENIKLGENTYYETGEDTVQEKLMLMSSCKNFILSNSTFSWWAQYLSKNDKKKVIAPSVWFADGTKCDIYEDGWNLINV